MTASSSPSRSTIATRQFRASASGSVVPGDGPVPVGRLHVLHAQRHGDHRQQLRRAREFLLKQAGPRDPRQRLRRPGCGHWFHHVHLLAVGRGRLSARAYPMLLANSKIGMYSSTTMVPTIAPTTSISNGSKTFPKTSTAWSRVLS